MVAKSENGEPRLYVCRMWSGEQYIRPMPGAVAELKETVDHAGTEFGEAQEK